MPLLLPQAGPVDAAELTDPQAVVEAFLRALVDGDLDRALALVADDVVYLNVGLPAVRGRARVDKVLRGLDRPGSSFEAYLHAISADGGVVLTERTDALVFGRFRTQFWVWGRFDVVDGRIVLWRDSFDVVDIVKGSLRGLVGMFLPGVAPKVPATADDAPGRARRSGSRPVPTATGR